MSAALTVRVLAAGVERVLGDAEQGPVDEDEGRESLRSLAAHLAGPAEIAKSLGVDANTINVWKVRHPDFPAPVRRLKSTDLDLEGPENVL